MSPFDPENYGQTMKPPRWKWYKWFERMVGRLTLLRASSSARMFSHINLTSPSAIFLCIIWSHGQSPQKQLTAAGERFCDVAISRSLCAFATATTTGLPLFQSHHLWQAGYKTTYIWGTRLQCQCHPNLCIEKNMPRRRVRNWNDAIKGIFGFHFHASTFNFAAYNSAYDK